MFTLFHHGEIQRNTRHCDWACPRALDSWRCCARATTIGKATITGRSPVGSFCAFSASFVLFGEKTGHTICSYTA